MPAPTGDVIINADTAMSPAHVAMLPGGTPPPRPYGAP
jgi:hypothetical protein